MFQLNKKIIAIIFVILIILLFITFAGIYFFDKDQNSVVTEKEKTTTVEEEKKEVNIDEPQEVLDCDSILDLNEKNICFENIAIEKKDLKICEKINTDNYISNCGDKIKLEIALEKKDISLCSQTEEYYYLFVCIKDLINQENFAKHKCSELSENEKNICNDIFLEKEAIQEDDISVCSEISAENRKQECFIKFIKEKDSLDFCELLDGDVKNICMEILVNELAINNKDINICEKLSDPDLYYECASNTQLFIDPDKDNLENEDEEKYGTDPHNPDSDGDGYLDGDEVKNGYDPMGEGKL